MLMLGASLALADELATLTGYLTDPNGLRVPNVTVQVTNVDTNIKYSGETNDEGLYRVSSIPTGTYRVVVQKTGFKTIVKQGVELHVQDVIALNFQLEVGSVAESVTVEAGASLINTTSAAVSTVVDQAYVKNMPLNGRSFQDLILLTPGVVTESPQVNGTRGLGEAGEFSVNGQRTESNYYTVDGVSANVGVAAGTNIIIGGGASGSIASSTALGTTQALVSVDALQEFRVQSSSYSAEYGRNPGGQFAFETKSGTNQWHGTAYDYLRNGFFDAQDWFNDYFGKPNGALRQNDFGGTLGGPFNVPHLYNGKDKTFFFFSYEGLRLTAPQPAAINFVPDLNLRSTAPATLQQALKAYPVPNGPEVLVTCNPATDPTCPSNGQKQNGLAQYIAAWSNPSSLDSTSARFDHAVNNKLKLFFRFSDTSSNSAIRGGGGFTPSVNNISAFTMRTYTAGASSMFTSRLSNEFRLNYSSNETTANQVIDSFGGSTPVDLEQMSGLGPGSFAQLTINLPGFALALQQQRPSGAQRQWNVVDTASLSLGRHQVIFGVDYRRLAPFEIVPTPNMFYIYVSQAAVQQNTPITLEQTKIPAYPLYTNFSAFAQDEWRVSHRFTLSVGLRWEVNPAPGVTQGLEPYTVQGSGPSTWVPAPQGTPLWSTTWYNFAPRLGAAYILNNAPGRETVLRAGGGVFFDTGQVFGSQGFNGAGFLKQAFQLNSVFPVMAATLAPAVVNPPVAPYGSVYGFASHLQLPYTVQWNASVEQAFGKSQALTVSYVGSHGARLLQQKVFNRPNPNISQATIFGNGLTSDYEALQVQVRRRLSRGLTALASYTWSHCLDYGSSNFQLGFQRGNCDFDARHSLSAAFSYDLPNVGHNGLASTLLHHWGLDDRFTARTAFPVPLNGRSLLQPDGSFFFGGLNLVPGQPVYLYGSNCASVLQALGDLTPGQGCPGGRAINPQAFANVSSGLGSAPRNFARGFGAWQMNLAVRREFPLYENLKLQFRAESFNIFNHPNFGPVNGSFGSTTFGQATSTLANSLGVLSPLYATGGPRSMQFALRLIF